MDELIWQEHTYVLEKAPGVGFGIAISGGRDNPGAQSGDTSIILSDVVKQGPAFDKLKINDIVLRVNGKPMYNMAHHQAVKELKNSGQRVELTIKRKVLVRVGRETPPPGRLSRSRSRDLDDLPLRRSRSRDLDRSPDRHRYRSRSRELDDSRRRHRSRSRDLDSRPRRHKSRGYDVSRSRSRTPPRSASSSPSVHRSRRGRSRSKSPPRRRRGRSFTPSSRSVTPPRRSSPEPKTVVLKKTRWNNSYGLKLGTRIFIQDIQPGSLADKSSEISAGDTILMINGRNVDNKSVQEAIQIIGLSKDKVTMLVKKQDGGTVSIPAERFRAPAGEREAADKHDDRKKEESETFTYSRSPVVPVEVKEAKIEPKSEKKKFGGVRVLPSGLAAAAAAAAPAHSSSDSESSRSTPEPAPRTKSEDESDPHYSIPPADDVDGPVLPPTARNIDFMKGKNVGIRLAGGNDVGIFVASVQENSPAAKKGLKMGDQILSVNGVNFRNIIREEAVLTLMGLPAGEEVNIVAQPQPKAFRKILEHGTGDSFYIRTHFKYEKSGDHEMSFKQGSAFRISDTLYQGMVGYWLAVRIGRNNMEIERGVIPNSSRAEQLKMVQDKKIAQMKERGKGGIGRRFGKNPRSDAPVSGTSSNMFPAYERVVLREAGFKRPVVIFGPLADISRERLAADYATAYEVARNEGTVSGQKSNRKGVIRLNTIKDIIEKDKHAVLDITPTAVQKLNYAQLYPIVVFLDPQSKAVVKDLRMRLACTEPEKKKKPGKLYDRAVKMQRGYSHVFNRYTIRLNSGDDWYRKLHSTIKDQQSTPVWVSEDKLGAAGAEDTEGVTVPGDDDQFSYV
uniref:Tight junction protein ZO-2 n=1 Tax=Ciona savignyi TaxID=51511 RepID=H2ZLR5_CIOSA